MIKSSQKSCRSIHSWWEGSNWSWKTKLLWKNLPMELPSRSIITRFMRKNSKSSFRICSPFSLDMRCWEFNISSSCLLRRIWRSWASTFCFVALSRNSSAMFNLLKWSTLISTLHNFSVKNFAFKRFPTRNVSIIYQIWNGKFPKIRWEIILWQLHHAWSYIQRIETFALIFVYWWYILFFLHRFQNFVDGRNSVDILLTINWQSPNYLESFFGIGRIIIIIRPVKKITKRISQTLKRNIQYFRLHLFRIRPICISLLVYHHEH